MAWTKAKTALVTGVIILAAGTTAVVIKKTAAQAKLTPQEIAGISQDAYAALSSYSSTGKAVAEMGDQTSTRTFSIKLQRPNLYRIDWTQTIGPSVSKGSVWSAGDGDYMMTAVGQEERGTPQRMRDMQQALTSAIAVSGQPATIPAAFFKQNFGDALGVAASGRFQVKKESDEKIGDVDCFVVSSVLDPATMPNQGAIPGNMGTLGTITTTLWIGKSDHLIHQIIHQTRTTMEGASIAAPKTSDATIKKMLENLKKPVTPENIAATREMLDASMKKAQSAMKSGKIVFTQTHENIVVNKKYSAADFAP
jgi:hypothetical protein